MGISIYSADLYLSNDLFDVVIYIKVCASCLKFMQLGEDNSLMPRKSRFPCFSTIIVTYFTF